LVEFFIDNTNDTGDYFQLCIDCDANGGTTPQSDDIRIDWMGHNIAGLTLYQGDGTGWVEFTDFTWEVDIYVAESISASPLNSNPHWIIELKMDRSKTEFDVAGSSYLPGTRIAVYDATTDTLQSWPPTSQDVPNDWGLETGTTEPIPETITIVTLVLLSAIAIVFGDHFLRKKAKPKI